MFFRVAPIRSLWPAHIFRSTQCTQTSDHTSTMAHDRHNLSSQLFAHSFLHHRLPIPFNHSPQTRTTHTHVECVAVGSRAGNVPRQNANDTPQNVTNANANCARAARRTRETAHTHTRAPGIKLRLPYGGRVTDDHYACLRLCVRAYLHTHTHTHMSV